MIEEDVKLDYCDVLIRPKRSDLVSRKDVRLVRHFKFRHCTRELSCIPIVAANMDTVGTFEMVKSFASWKSDFAETEGPLVAVHKYYSLEDWEQHFRDDYINASPVHWSNNITGGPISWTAIPSFGINDLDRIKKFIARFNPNKYPYGFICLDVANGYTQSFLKFVEGVRECVGNSIGIIAGNVVTQEMTESLILAGADIVKVGIGPGSACTTRKVAGVGYPQLSAVMECADAAHGIGGHIMADGGCQCSGDVAKAFGAGADFVMLGGMLAGHRECGGEVFYHEGVAYREFYGMSSSKAMLRHTGEVANYRAAEGKSIVLPCKGDVEKTVRDILGGVRSACTYMGAKTIKDMAKCTTFVRANRQINTMFG